MHPFGSYLAVKPHLEGQRDARRAEVGAMYRRPDCPPLPREVDQPSRLRRLVDAVPGLRRLSPRQA
jgi:hypothetical protein